MKMKVVEAKEVSIKKSLPTIIETVVARFGKYSAHIIVPNTWVGKRVTAKVIPS